MFVSLGRKSPPIERPLQQAPRHLGSVWLVGLPLGAGVDLLGKRWREAKCHYWVVPDAGATGAASFF